MTDEAKALVERLRYQGYLNSDNGDWGLRNPDGPVAADLIETQAREIERLRGLLLKAADWLKAAPIESGVCCCGDPMDSHDFYDGHMPVDAVQYSAMQLHKEIHAALAGDSHDLQG